MLLRLVSLELVYECVVRISPVNVVKTFHSSTIISSVPFNFARHVLKYHQHEHAESRQSYRSVAYNIDGKSIAKYMQNVQK